MARYGCYERGELCEARKRTSMRRSPLCRHTRYAFTYGDAAMRSVSSMFILNMPLRYYILRYQRRFSPPPYATMMRRAFARDIDHD